MSGKELTGTKGGQVIVVHPTPSKIDLRNSYAIRRELASVYRDARCGTIETTEATKLAYILDQLRKIYETEVLEARLIALEERQQ